MDSNLVRILFFFYAFKEIRGQCPCAGLKVSLTDQLHCFEILDPKSSSWIDADKACAAKGGFMAHINSSDLYGKLSAFVKENYKKPIMTGATVGNPQLKLLALMCPKNSYYSMLEESTIDSLLTGTPDLTRRCVYFEGSDNKLAYDKCDKDSQVLCDFPLEKPNYCNSKMNCTSTTTTTTSTTSILISSTTTTTSATSTSATTSPDFKTTAPIVPPVVPHPNATTTVEGITTTTELPKTKTPSSTSTSTKTPTPTSTTLSTSVATTGKRVSTTTTNLMTTSSPSIDTKCGSGYTSFGGGWCVPWWVWLLLGLLLLLLLLCCLGWLLHLCCACCLGCLPSRVVHVDRERPYGIDKEMQTVSVQMQDSATDHIATPSKSIPPSPPTVPLTAPVAKPPVVYEIVEKNEIIFAPVPHASMNNPGMLIPPPGVDSDRISNHSMPLYVEPARERPMDSSHLKQPELAAMATMAAKRKANPKKESFQELPYSMPPNGKMKPELESRPSTRSSVLTISPERSPHEVPSTPVNDHSPPRPFALGPLPLSQNQNSPNNAKKSSRPEKGKNRPFPRPPPSKANNSPDGDRPTRKFPSKRPIESPELPKRKFPARSPYDERPEPPPSSLSSNSLFDQEPLRRDGMDRASRAMNRDKNLRAVDKERGFQKDERGLRGGVVGGKDAPTGWKPWSNTAGTFSKNPGFLDD
ncbi:hypothetical protein QR680_002104 [Steinernema hermaphroditum]|uniref:C-type lectin domain-containing protein n=1 Tax=Steinernema hermaphroditum TaxID=289476 RepID=A0AA39H196_9BILA|nr:hypothetical protein QR680_002104 [Steinernema hermaphroditum]